MAVGGSFTGLFRVNDITAPIPAELVVDWVRIYDNGFTILGGTSIEPGSEFTHVDSIVPETTGGGPNKRATAAVTIRDEYGAPVDGASVTGTFTGSHNETVTATTDASGVADLVTSVRSRDSAFQVCVDDVVKSGMTYDPPSNVETCDTH